MSLISPLNCSRHKIRSAIDRCNCEVDTRFDNNVCGVCAIHPCLVIRQLWRPIRNTSNFMPEKSIVCNTVMSFHSETNRRPTVVDHIIINRYQLAYN